MFSVCGFGFAFFLSSHSYGVYSFSVCEREQGSKHGNCTQTSVSEPTLLPGPIPVIRSVLTPLSCLFPPFLILGSDYSLHHQSHPYLYFCVCVCAFLLSKTLTSLNILYETILFLHLLSSSFLMASPFLGDLIHPDSSSGPCPVSAG